ncbi:MAG: 3-deoxy-7-phosphoheptulonate synthase [Tissierellia bacterium]|nr:3-deoxy-7-phosphoheptulonate synthase [Tissierellia bacterium]
MTKLKKLLEKEIFIAGPCSIEDRDQVFRIGKKLKDLGVEIFRAGAFKPRTSPHTFQGIGKEGLDYLRELKKEMGFYIVSEIVDPRHLDYFEDIDILQVGTRNMQNFELLKELGKTDKYILLKRGMAATVEEFIQASEYIRSMGNEKIILCERGIRTFENSTRYTLDISSIPILKERTPYKVIVDSSHATGIARYVSPVALGGIAAGADGFLIEVHDRPDQALTDKDQAILPEELEPIINKSRQIRKIIER